LFRSRPAGGERCRPKDDGAFAGGAGETGITTGGNGSNWAAARPDRQNQEQIPLAYLTENQRVGSGRAPVVPYSPGDAPRAASGGPDHHRRKSLFRVIILLSNPFWAKLTSMKHTILLGRPVFWRKEELFDGI